LLRAAVRSFGTVCGDGDHAPAGLQHAPRFLQSLTTHRVKHNVHVLDDLFKARRLVVDDLLGAELQHEVAVACRYGSDHTRSAKPGELDRENTDRA
jgi:hypothetical protein